MLNIECEYSFCPQRIKAEVTSISVVSVEVGHISGDDKDSFGLRLVTLATVDENVVVSGNIDSSSKAQWMQHPEIARIIDSKPQVLLRGMDIFRWTSEWSICNHCVLCEHYYCLLDICKQRTYVCTAYSIHMYICTAYSIHMYICTYVLHMAYTCTYVLHIAYIRMYCI